MFERHDPPCRRQIRLTPPGATTAWRHFMRPGEAFLTGPARGWWWDGHRFQSIQDHDVVRLSGDSTWSRFFRGRFHRLDLDAGAVVGVTCVRPGDPPIVLRHQGCLVVDTFEQAGRQHLVCTPEFDDDGVLPDAFTVVVEATAVFPIVGANEREPSELEYAGGGGVDVEDEDEDPLDACDQDDIDDQEPALHSDNPADYDVAECFGEPGLVWFTRAQPVLGAQLRPGDWLDSLDHSGAREIHHILPLHEPSGTRRVAFSDDDEDSQLIEISVTYSVVDPDSIVAPDGTPLI